MPIELQPYRSPYTTNIANLIGGADQARAEGIRRSGAAVAQGVESVGTIAGATANNLVRLKLDEPRRQLEQLQLSEAQRANADDLAARDAFTKAQGDPDKAVQFLESSGNWHVSMKLRSEINQQRLRDIETQGKLLDNTEKRLGQVTQLLQAVENDPDPATAYARVLPTARQYAGPQLAQSLPDTYDAAAVHQGISWGMKSVDYARQRRDAATTAASALRGAVTRLDLNEKMTTALAQYAQTIDSQEEWTNARQEMVHASGDVATDVLKKFPEVWTPDLKTQAQKYLVADPTKFQTKAVTYTDADGKTHIGEAGYDQRRNLWFAPGDNEHPLTNVAPLPAADKLQPADIERAARAVVEDPAAWTGLTDTFRSAIFPRAHELGFTVPTKDPAAPSVTAVETLRQRAIRDLNTERTNRNLGTDGMPPEEYADRLKAIEQKFSSPPFTKPTAPVAPKAPTAPAAGPAQSSVTTTHMYQSTAPGAKPIPIPDVVVNAPIPQGQPGIRIRMSDGTIWIKRANGVIEPGR